MEEVKRKRRRGWRKIKGAGERGGEGRIGENGEVEKEKRRG